MTYEQALSFIHSSSMFGAKPGLERTARLLHTLGDPQNKLRFVHVAGTNGKGSTCAMLESILRAAGYKTGLFTSPYLQRFNERIRVNGKSISDDALAAAAEKVACAAGDDKYTEFELDTALGMEYFAAQKCDIVVLEVGLGGRLDPTNIIDHPECAVITNIGLDHTSILGDTVEKIAAEKAGIIKQGCSVAMYQPENEGVEDIVAGICRSKGASLRIADFDELELLSDGLEGQEFCYCDDRPLFLPLLGDHQLRNTAVALEAVEILKERGWRIKDEAVEEGLSRVKWPARFELVSASPAVIIDGGHNVQCAETIRENLEYYFPECRRVLLLGIMADKDVDGFLETLAPAGDIFVCVAPDSPRALPARELAKKLGGAGKPVFVCQDIPGGIKTAVDAAGPDGMVCAAGSLYMAGDLRTHFGLESE